MYYITKKDSETGKKFQEVYKEIERCNKAANKLAKELGSNKQYLQARWLIAGGMEGVILPKGTDNPALRLDKKSPYQNTYVPNLKTKEGKELKKRFAELPGVTKPQLNSVIGYSDGHFSNIGFNVNNPDYFAFSVKENWEVKMPEDCIEITTTQYKEMFKQD